MSSPTFGNKLFIVTQTSTGLYVSLYYETGRNSLNIVHAVPAMCWPLKPNDPFICSIDKPATDFYTQVELDALLEQHSTQLHPANCL